MSNKTVDIVYQTWFLAAEQSTRTETSSLQKFKSMEPMSGVEPLTY